MRKYFFDLDEQLVGSGSREVERLAFRLSTRRHDSWGEIKYLEFSKKVKSHAKSRRRQGFNSFRFSATVGRPFREYLLLEFSK